MLSDDEAINNSATSAKVGSCNSLTAGGRTMETSGRLDLSTPKPRPRAPASRLGPKNKSPARDGAELGPEYETTKRHSRQQNPRLIRGSATLPYRFSHIVDQKQRGARKGMRPVGNCGDAQNSVSANPDSRQHVGDQSGDFECQSASDW
jgi:hypothetical protein